MTASNVVYVLSYINSNLLIVCNMVDIDLSKEAAVNLGTEQRQDKQSAPPI